ncbi:MAG: hypothetical protein EOM02_08290 [Synergistales bacterium]|nr:hypothetical protein [Synergistales bacterium]
MSQVDIAYFCSDGYTELGAIQEFLEKIAPSACVNWTRVRQSIREGRIPFEISVNNINRESRESLPFEPRLI